MSGHLDRDTAFALEQGEDDLPQRFKLWFGRAFDLAETSTISPPRQSPAKRTLEMQLTSLLRRADGCDLARQLQPNRAGAGPASIFSDYPGEVDATNNGSERRLRPYVRAR